MAAPEYDGFVFDNLNGDFVRGFEGYFPNSHIKKSYYGLFHLNSSVTINIPFEEVTSSRLKNFLDRIEVDTLKNSCFIVGEKNNLYVSFQDNYSMGLQDGFLSVSKSGLPLGEVDVSVRYLNNVVYMLASRYYLAQKKK